jgi:hypothetical protein
MDLGFFESLDIALGAFLVLLGVLAGWFANTTTQRVLWTIGLVVAGVIAVVATTEARKQTRIAILGGDHFYAVSFLYGPGMDPKGQFPLAISNFKAEPIYDATFVITKEGDFFQNGIVVSVGTLFPTDILRRLPTQLPLGSYILDLHSKAGGAFFEKLTLSQAADGNFHQSYYVRRIGGGERLIDVR